MKKKTIKRGKGARDENKENKHRKEKKIKTTAAWERERPREWPQRDQDTRGGSDRVPTAQDSLQLLPPVG